MPPKSTSPSPESGISTEFLELEGTTTFVPAPSPTHRYSIALKNGKLRIWLEDCESKKQWSTSDLDLGQYVDKENAIPGAAATEYVEFFRVLLDKPAEAGVLPRTFRRIKEDVFRLELSMKFQILMRSRVATYIFDLEPITVERIDVLESKVRDLQGQLKTQQTNADHERAEQQKEVEKLQLRLDDREAAISNLEEKVKTLEEGARPTVIQAQATTSVDQVIIWGAADDYINGTDGIIRDLNKGLYEITAFYHTRHQTTIKLSSS